MSNVCYVTTKSELKSALNRKEKEIVVTGKLAKDLYSARKLAKLSAATVAALSAAIAAAVLIPGPGTLLSAVAAAPIAIKFGVDVPVIILAASVGVGTILAIFNGYDVEFRLAPPVLKLTKK